MQLERRVSSVIATDPEQRVYITSPEDVILSKLEWYRLGGEISDRQWRDIVGVLKTRASSILNISENGQGNLESQVFLNAL
jgi:hypothetical protein